MSKEEYDTCTVNSDARIIAKCDSPQQIKYFTITFRSFTPQPGGLEFHPGKDYYFITTSTGDTSSNGLNNKIGGRCKSAHMKVTFKVCCGSNTQQNSNSNINNNNNNQQQQQRQSTPLSSSSSSPFFSLPANSNVSNTVNTNSSLMPPHISPLTATGGSQGTPAMQSSEPSRVLYASSTVEPPFKSDFRIPSPTFASTQDITMHSFSTGSTGNTRNQHHPYSHHPSRNGGQISSGQTNPSLSNNPTPTWWKTRPPNKHDAFTPEDRTSTSSPGGNGGHRKGRAWLLIVAAGIAVGVACLIVCFLGVGRRLFIREKHKQSTVINYSI